MTLSKEWQEYDGDYQKKRQDIKLKDGRTILNCWPNAGVWVVLENGVIPDIPNDQVTHVRLSIMYPKLG